MMVQGDIIRRAHASLSCEPTINADGHLACSLSTVCSSVFDLLAVRHDPSLWAMPMETIAGKAEDHAPNGSYL
jgi:hypothetical protein